MGSFYSAALGVLSSLVISTFTLILVVGQTSGGQLHATLDNMGFVSKEVSGWITVGLSRHASRARLDDGKPYKHKIGTLDPAELLRVQKWEAVKTKPKKGETKQSRIPFLISWVPSTVF